MDLILDCWKHRHIMAEIKNKGSDGQLVDARETGDGGDRCAK